MTAIAFGDFELDEAARTLRLNGEAPSGCTCGSPISWSRPVTRKAPASSVAPRISPPRASVPAGSPSHDAGPAAARQAAGLA